MHLLTDVQAHTCRHMYTSMLAHTDACMHTRAHIHTCGSQAHTHLPPHACTHTHNPIHAQELTGMCSHHTRTDIQTLARTCMRNVHARGHAHTHTHMHTQHACMQGTPFPPSCTCTHAAHTQTGALHTTQVRTILCSEQVRRRKRRKVDTSFSFL